MPTFDERFAEVEQDLNRIMEALQEAATVDDAALLTDLSDEQIQRLIDRVRRLESRLTALQYKHQLIRKRLG